VSGERKERGSPTLSVEGEAVSTVPAVSALLRSLGLRCPTEIGRLAKELVPTEGHGEADDDFAMTRIGNWFACMLNQPDLSPEQAFAFGRAAWIAIDGPVRWPAVLLKASPPDAFIHELIGNIVAPCPPPAPMPMPLQDL